MSIFNRIFKTPKLQLPGFEGTPSHVEGSTMMPPGYKLQTDGHEYRFVNIGNGSESGTYGTAEYAAQLAWHVYNKMKEGQSRYWRDI